MRLVVDTNVIVSALLKPGSVPDRALAMILDGGFVVLHDARIEAEYREVCGRRKFRAIPRDRIAALLAALIDGGERLDAVPRFSGEMTDDGDRAFVEVALAGGADAIVTGNARHFPDDLGFAVRPPAELLAELEG